MMTDQERADLARYQPSAERVAKARASVRAHVPAVDGTRPAYLTGIVGRSEPGAMAGPTEGICPHGHAVEKVDVGQGWTEEWAGSCKVCPDAPLDLYKAGAPYGG